METYLEVDEIVALKYLLDYVERHNKQDVDEDAAEAQLVVAYLVSRAKVIRD